MKPQQKKSDVISSCSCHYFFFSFQQSTIEFMFLRCGYQCSQFHLYFICVLGQMKKINIVLESSKVFHRNILNMNTSSDLRILTWSRTHHTPLQNKNKKNIK